MRWKLWLTNQVDGFDVLQCDCGCSHVRPIPRNSRHFLNETELRNDVIQVMDPSTVGHMENSKGAPNREFQLYPRQFHQAVRLSRDWFGSITGS
jgi:hypothetical protein